MEPMGKGFGRRGFRLQVLIRLERFGLSVDEFSFGFLLQSLQVFLRALIGLGFRV